MLLFKLALFAALGSRLVEATNCRTSRCNAAIADALHCDRNSHPSKLVAALGCKHFYSTTVHRGCTTKTVTKTKQRGTVTRTTIRTSTKSVTLPAAFVTRTATKDITTTVRTDTATQTSTDSTETIISTDFDTVTQQATVTTGTDTITQTVSATVTETITQTVTITPSKRGIDYPKKLAEGVIEPREIAERGQAYQIKYPSVPKSVKSCFNTRSYSSACSCFGAKPSTVVRPSTTKTVTTTKTLPSATRTVTRTASKTVTKPQKTNTATRTTTVFQTRVFTTTITVYVTATNYFTESDTVTATDVDSVAATKTDTETVTTTVTEAVATETVVNNIVGGGSCGCTYEARPNSRCADGTVFRRTVVVGSLAACARNCDDYFTCSSWDYEQATGTCRQTYSECTVVGADGFFRGDEVGRCEGACTMF